MNDHAVGIIGLGNMGRRHAEIVAAYPTARVEAVVDTAEDRLQDAAERYGARAFRSVDDMLSATDLDVVMVCTPDSLHLHPTIKCLEAGKHVFLEKPIATSLEEADEIVRAADRAEGKFAVGHCLRFDPRYVAVKRRIDAGSLGKLVGISTRRQNRLVGAERLKGRVSSQLFLGVHDYDVANWYLASSPVEVYCASTSMTLRAKGLGVDDAAWTTIRYASGAVVVAETGWLLPNDYPLGYRFELHAFGQAGTAHLEYLDEGLAFAAGTWQFEQTGDRLTPQLAHFLNCIDDDVSPLVTARDGRVAVAVALAAEESATSRKPVAVTPATAW